jgi:hypothetical protein
MPVRRYIDSFADLHRKPITVSDGGSGTPVGDASRLVKDVIIDPSVSVGDLVYYNDNGSGNVLPITNNRGEEFAGIIIEIDGTDGKLLTYGQCDFIYSGITVNEKVFISTSGNPTNTPPSTGYVETIGLCNISGKIFVDRNPNRIKRQPF